MIRRILACCWLILFSLHVYAQCDSQPDGTPCDDGNACTSGDVCIGGVCTGTLNSCDDGNACTTDSCDPATGFCINTPVVCNDNNPCTDDSCDPGTGCVFTPNTAACSDGNACTIGDICSGGVCAGTPISCDDGNACTIDSCDPILGCVNTPVNCDDGNVCTDDVCDPVLGCQNIPNSAACSDGNACTSGDLCSGGVCAGTPITCDDGNPNTIDSCDPILGCVFTALPVVLTSFEAKMEAGAIAISWETASETNNAGFQVQKSQDNRIWEQVDFIEGQGTTSSASQYEYADQFPRIGTNYYRLKQIDLDGSLTYSNVIELAYERLNPDLLVYPNPSNGNLNLHITHIPSGEPMTIEVINNMGQQFYEKEVRTSEAHWRGELQLTQNGLYVIVIKTGQEVFYKRVVILK